MVNGSYAACYWFWIKLPDIDNPVFFSPYYKLMKEGRKWYPAVRGYIFLTGSLALSVAGEECPNWMVPISICTSEDPKCTKLKVLLDRPETIITLSGINTDQWIKVKPWCHNITENTKNPSSNCWIIMDIHFKAEKQVSFDFLFILDWACLYNLCA